MNGEQGHAARGRGRPRSTQADAAIREAAWRILAERGFEGLTIEAVAEAAGCSRTTLYRRFGSKLELVGTILYETSRAMEPSLPGTADPREVLIAHSSVFAAYMSGPRGRALIGLTQAAARYPELGETMMRYMIGEREYYYAAFRRLAAPDIDDARMAYVFDTLVGSIMFHVGMSGRQLSAAQIEELVDMTLPLLRGREGSRRP